VGRGTVRRADDRRTIRQPHVLTVERLTVAYLATVPEARAQDIVTAIEAHPDRPVIDAYRLVTAVYSTLSRLGRLGHVRMRTGRLRPELRQSMLYRRVPDAE